MSASATRGDEVPEALRTREGRGAALAEARERMQAEREATRASRSPLAWSLT